MSKFRVQMTVSVEIATEVRADSLEQALSKARDLAMMCPVDAGLIRLPAKTEYLWNNESTVTGVLAP